MGSLLRPFYLQEARRDAREGRVSAAEVQAAEDRAVREAIAMQEAAGLEVITDGELRRQSWVVTIPLRESGAARAPLAGFEFLPAPPGWWSLWKEPDGRRAEVWTSPTRPFVTKPIEVVRDIVADEYAFLKTHARHRTKLTIPAPSWHRIFWHPEYSRAAYPTPESFLRAIATYLRESVLPKLIAAGGDYLLLEYDTPRAGDFGPLRHVGPDTVVVLGLFTTKQGALEDAGAVETRIREAARHVPLARLAVSPQCGFASGEAGNPLTPDEQAAKLRRVTEVARRVWRAG